MDAAFARRRLRLRNDRVGLRFGQVFERSSTTGVHDPVCAICASSSRPLSPNMETLNARQLRKKR
jgi:hypothetical protein